MHHMQEFKHVLRNKESLAVDGDGDDDEDCAIFITTTSRTSTICNAHTRRRYCAGPSSFAVEIYINMSSFVRIWCRCMQFIPRWHENETKQKQPPHPSVDGKMPNSRHYTHAHTQSCRCRYTLHIQWEKSARTLARTTMTKASLSQTAPCVCRSVCARGDVSRESVIARVDVPRFISRVFAVDFNVLLAPYDVSLPLQEQPK